MTGRLLAISDLHIGYPENRAYADSLAPADPGDWLIVAGDVGEVFADVGFVLASLANRFAQVIWVPGNHELWTTPGDPVALRGVARYEALLKVCRRFGVLTPEDEFPVWPGPGGPVTVAPLFTLYDYSFGPAGRAEAGNATATGSGDDAVQGRSAAGIAIATASRADAVQAADAAGIAPADEGRLHADPYPSVAQWCRARVTATQARLDALDGPAVLVSHWPLIPEPLAALRHPAYAPWCGTTLTVGWHRRYPVAAAVYGHLHIPRTSYYDGVLFEEVSVGYPREWRRRGSAPPPPRVILGGAVA
ncbi:MAG: metallophosphoesterase [Trebonia sp.]|jgi:predicted phosphodiesterase